ncbi:unnamed protein product [Meloidogyne enterolobii]|uniref:Uncharacterized protein n=1 Tax=Meloidogyne enterolobii TaxID=390850 RepID=A0ACB0XQ43_MELEN
MCRKLCFLKVCGLRLADPDPKKVGYRGIFGSDAGSRYPKISNYPPTLLRIFADKYIADNLICGQFLRTIFTGTICGQFLRGTICILFFADFNCGHYFECTILWKLQINFNYGSFLRTFLSDIFLRTFFTTFLADIFCELFL